MENNMVTSLTLRMGPHSVPVSSLLDASRKHDTLITASLKEGLGPDDVPNAFVFDGSKRIARISWNSRVWPDSPWKPGMKELI